MVSAAFGAIALIAGYALVFELFDFFTWREWP